MSVWERLFWTEDKQLVENKRQALRAAHRSARRREPRWASATLFRACQIACAVEIVLALAAQFRAGDGPSGWNSWRIAAVAVLVVAAIIAVSDYAIKRRMKRDGRWPEAATGPEPPGPPDDSVRTPQSGTIYTGRADQAVLVEWLKERRRKRAERTP